MAVSLKKTKSVREYTHEHLIDEEKAVRTFCPPRESAAKGVSDQK